MRARVLQHAARQPPSPPATAAAAPARRCGLRGPPRGRERGCPVRLRRAAGRAAAAGAHPAESASREGQRRRWRATAGQQHRIERAAIDARRTAPAIVRQRGCPLTCVGPVAARVEGGSPPATPSAALGSPCAEAAAAGAAAGAAAPTCGAPSLDAAPAPRCAPGRWRQTATTRRTASGHTTAAATAAAAALSAGSNFAAIAVSMDTYDIVTGSDP